MAQHENLYLMQHGEAMAEQEDPARPLTDLGRGHVERVARAAGRIGLGIEQVVHSGKLRARQTAEIVVACLEPAPAFTEMSGLGPNDDPRIAAEAVGASPEPRLLVGHLPHLSRLASLLILGDAGKGIVAFRMGGLVCLAKSDDGWRVAWALTPEVVHGDLIR